jgi:hypothetical protein
MHLKKALIDTELSAYIPSALNFYMLFFKTYICTVYSTYMRTRKM